MNDLRKAAEMALEALGLYQSKMSVQMFDEAIAALRQALEKDADEWYEKALWGSQPVDAVNMTQESVDETAKGEQEPWVKTYCGGKPNYCATQDTTQVTMQVTTQMAKRKTLVELLDSTPDDAVNMPEECVHKTDKREQEPVCFLTETAWSYEIANWGDPNGFPVYTVPPQKEWVGLTDKEKNELVDAFYGTDIQRLEAIEAKLKEKNT